MEIQIEFADGKKRSVTFLGEGQVFGELALIDQGARSAAVIVVADNTVIYKLPAEDFLGLCRTDTMIGFIMMRNLAQDISFKLRHQNLFATNM